MGNASNTNSGRSRLAIRVEGKRDFGGEAAIGRVPVVSASGKLLMPCKQAKAKKLLEAGKAIKRWREDGAFYIQLKFNPSSPIVHPLTTFGNESVETSPSIQIKELVRVREAGKRNGRYYNLRKRKDGRVQLGVLEASIAYLRKGYRIVSATLKEALEAVVERLQPASNTLVSKSRILRMGREKAVELLDKFRRHGVLRWAPQLSVWLKSEDYMFYLGITQITSLDYAL